MRLRCSGMVGIKTDDGFTFGSLRWMGREELCATVEEPLLPGTACTLKVELRERPTALLLAGRVVEREADPGGGPDRYRFATRALDAEQAARLEAWLEDLEAGGSSVHPHLWSREAAHEGSSVVSDAFEPDGRPRRRLRDVLRARLGRSDPATPEEADDDVVVTIPPEDD